MSVTLTLRYFVLLNEGQLDKLTLAAGPTDYFSDLRKAIYIEHSGYFSCNNVLDDFDLDLYIPENPLQVEGRDLLSRAKAETDNLEPAHATTLIQSVFRENALDKSLVHLVVKQRPDGVPPGWKREDPDSHWKDFYNYWRNKGIDETLKLGIIPLAFDDHGFDHSSYRLPYLKGCSRSILVLKAYKLLFERTLKLQQLFPLSGVVLTGQPGTGKTIWLWFMLICLLAKNEVVAFYGMGATRLFYNGQVYVSSQISTSDFPPDLTIGKTGKTGKTIWCLIDADPRVEPPPTALVATGSPIFPIQACTPNNKRYKEWVKQRWGRVWGLSLWTQQELKAGASLDSECIRLLDSLKGVLQNFPNQNTNDLFTERAREIISEAGPNYADIGDVHKRAEAILEWLLECTIVDVGEAPRDVYRALWAPLKIKEPIERAEKEVSLEDLLKIMSKNSFDATSSDVYPSRTIISISPIPAEYFWEDDDFEANFRSAHVRTLIIKRIALLHHEEAKQVCNIYRSIPRTAPVAGDTFEGLTHRFLCGMDRSSLSGPLMLMEQSSKNARLFSMSPGPTQARLSLPIRRRQYTFVSYKQEGGQWNLSWTPEGAELPPLEQRFCVPTAHNKALFDTFFVEFERTEDSITPIIWTFQVTIYTEHDGSKHGHPKIDLIKEVALERASLLAECRDEADISERKQKRRKMEVKAVEVNYVLICPASQKRHSWTMPNGWDPGDSVFCQFIKAYV